MLAYGPPAAGLSNSLLQRTLHNLPSQRTLPDPARTHTTPHTMIMPPLSRFPRKLIRSSAVPAGRRSCPYDFSDEYDGAGGLQRALGATRSSRSLEERAARSSRYGRARERIHSAREGAQALAISVRA